MNITNKIVDFNKKETDSFSFLVKNFFNIEKIKFNDDNDNFYKNFLETNVFYKKIENIFLNNIRYIKNFSMNKLYKNHDFIKFNENFSFFVNKKMDVLFKPFFHLGTSAIYFNDINVTEINFICKNHQKNKNTSIIFKTLPFVHLNVFDCYLFFGKIYYDFLTKELEDFKNKNEQTLEKELYFTSFFTPVFKFKLEKKNKNKISLFIKVTPEKINDEYYLINGIDYIEYDPYLLKIELLFISTYMFDKAIILQETLGLYF